MRASKLVSGVVAAFAVVFTVGVAAQPRRGAPRAAADAGADAAPDAGPKPRETAAAPDAGVPLVVDGGVPTASSADASVVAADAGRPAAIPTFRPHAPSLAPPSPQQIAAYEAMRSEADVYERGARDYKDAVTTIISLYYEQKKRAILGGLDNEIGVEKAELKKARETAIKRLEDFVARYSGPSAQPEATPDAMYRLAALYEERARSDEDPNSDLAVTLKPAIALYKKVIQQFPAYKELAGIYYFLGHALADSRRFDESQQVWRSLVCRNHYKYPTPADAKDPDKDTVVAMPQDHDTEYWKRWRGQYNRPEALKKGPKEDVVFDDPYPADCQGIAQPNIPAGSDPKYVAEVWWRIGDWEFDMMDNGGGVLEYEPFAVWDYNRAASAYTRSMQSLQRNKMNVIYGVALYKYAWTLFKQQRYEAAAAEFVRLLDYTDEREKATGDAGADFRQEAFTYIAGSLDIFDFAGPGADEPYIARPDVLDTAKSPAEAEQKLHVGIDRVQSASLIPQDRKWTIEVYKALATEYRAINQYHNALAVYDLMLQKWPMEPSAPETQNSMAELYVLLANQTKTGDPLRPEYERKVLEARTALAKYIGDTPWVDANKDNPAALQRAEELVRTGLKGAAITHTKNGQAAIEAAQQTSDPKEQVRQLNVALQEYKLATIAWIGYIKQDENAPDAYKSRYFYADALFNQVQIELTLHGKVDPKQYAEPTSQEIQQAKQAAVDVRDSDEDDQFIDNAAIFVVTLVDADRDLAYARFKDTGGTQGIEPRTEPRLEGPDDDRKVVEEEIPEVIKASMQARDEYVERVPPDKQHPDDKGVMPAATYAFYAATEYFVRGHFKEAADRFEPLWKEHCGKDPMGYEAWKRLIIMSNLQKNDARSRELATAEKNKSCAVSDLQVAEAKHGDLTDLVLQNAAFADANKIFDQAKKSVCMDPYNKDPQCKAVAPPDSEKLWRQAGGMYEAALRAAPGHKDAPAAAINSAFCYKQVGEFNKAIDLYQLFIDNYGKEETLQRLDKGGTDPEKKSKLAPNPAEYKERIKYLGMAYDALSTTYYGFFAYQRAAESFARIANNPRFDDARRSNAARIAMVLDSNLGDRANMSKMYAVLVDPKNHLPGDKRAEADYLRASFDYGQWNPSTGESAGNGAARRQAITSLEAFHNTYKNKPDGARFALEAAYRIAKMLQAGGDPAYRTWFKTTVADWEFFKLHTFATSTPDGKPVTISATDAPYGDYGGEADFTLVDEQVHDGFDYSTGHHHYKNGTNAAEISKTLDKDVAEAHGKWEPPLVHIAKTYNSFEWAAAATARIGSLYDSIRQGLELFAPEYFTPQQKAKFNELMAKADKIGNLPPAACQATSGKSCTDVADDIRDSVQQTQDQVKAKWRQTKDTYMEELGKQSVPKYVTAAMIARKYSVRNATVMGGIGRLAQLTDYMGDDKMKAYVEQTDDPLNSGQKLTYVNHEFLQWRAGVVSAPPANGEPAPQPAAP